MLKLLVERWKIYVIRRIQLETSMRIDKGKAEGRKVHRNPDNKSGEETQGTEYALESTF